MTPSPLENNPSPAPLETEDGHNQSALLSSLGRITGIGGITVGILLSIFQTLLKLGVFPNLASEQTYRLFVLALILTYGIAVIGLAIWASQSKVRKFIIWSLTVFALILGLASLYMLQSSPVGGTYHLRITVLTPQGVPADDARVWSTIGGELASVPGGWLLEIPTERRSEDRHFTIYAAQENAFLRGETQVLLGENRSPTVTITLIQQAQAKVRGLVLDKKRLAVEGARVSVVGYGEESVLTGPDGGFMLDAHAAKDQQVELHVEKGKSSLNQFHPAGGSSITLQLP